MNKSELKDLIKSTIEEIIQEAEYTVNDKDDVPKDLEDEDIVNISKKLTQRLQNPDSNVKTQSDKLKNIGDRFKSKPVKLKDI